MAFGYQRASFEVTLRDLDERLIDHIGDDRKPPFAGSWDGVTSRSMERIQLIFNNRGDRDAAWHSYSLNDFDEDDRGAFHQRLRNQIGSRVSGAYICYARRTK